MRHKVAASKLAVAAARFSAQGYEAPLLSGFSPATCGFGRLRWAGRDRMRPARIAPLRKPD